MFWYNENTSYSLQYWDTLVRIWTNGSSPILESTCEVVSPESLTKKGRTGLYHITQLRETRNDILIRQLPEISLNLGAVSNNWLGGLDFSEVILFLFICGFIDYVSSYTEQVKIFIFLIISHLINGQCLWKRKTLCKKYTWQTPIALIIQSLSWTWHNLESCPQCSMLFP